MATNPIKAPEAPIPPILFLRMKRLIADEKKLDKNNAPKYTAAVLIVPNSFSTILPNIRIPNILPNR